MSHYDTISALSEVGIVAVIRAPSASAAVDAVDALVAGGVRGIEVTYSTPDAPAALREIAERHGDDVLLGAGTILQAAQAREAVAAGARFLVSPGIDDEVAEAMTRTGAVTMLGALTPTEIMRAIRLGTHVVKVFPGSLVGPSYLRAMRGPFPDVGMMPTGGVSPDNVGAWLQNGAIAVGAGGELVPGAALARRDWGAITEKARRFTDALREQRPVRPS